MRTSAVVNCAVPIYSVCQVCDLAGLERMYKHLTCLVVLKSCAAEQSTKEERAWKQSGNLTIHQQGPLFTYPFSHSVQENTKIK